MSLVQKNDLLLVQRGSALYKSTAGELGLPAPGLPSVVAFGATGNGVTNDAPAFTSASQGTSGFSVPAGSYLISQSISVSVPVVVQPGATFVIPDGVTLTFTANFQATLRKCFTITGTGKVVLSSSATAVGHPEWWGAVRNSGAPADTLANDVAILSCIEAVAITQLQAADYFISKTLVISTPCRTLQGVGQNWQTGAPVTRLLVSNGTDTVIRIAKVPDPGPVPNDFLRETTIRNMTVTRAVVPVPPTAGNEMSGPAGIMFEKTLFTYVENVWSSEHYIGYMLNGTIQTHLENCFAFRSVAGSSPTNDKFFGYWLNGYASVGLAGGNASSYIVDCNTTINGALSLVESIGWYLPGSYVDTFLIRPELSNGRYGILVDGTGASQSGTADLHIDTPIIDTYSVAGISISNVNSYGAINIDGGYLAPLSTGQFGLRVSNCSGMISATNLQVVGWPSSNNFAGLYVDSSSGVNTSGCMYLGCTRPVVYNASTLCRCLDTIRNPSQTVSTAAVTLTGGSTRNYISPNVSGGNGVIAYGVQIPTGAGNGYNTIDPTLINPTCLPGGSSARKVNINGSAVTTVGSDTFNNYITGVVG